MNKVKPINKIHEQLTEGKHWKHKLITDIIAHEILRYTANKTYDSTETDQ